MERRALLSSLESAALGGALVLVGGGVGAVLYKPPQRPALPAPQAPRFEPAPAPPPEAAPPPAALAPMRPGELSALLERHKDDPVASRFASEFLANPGLRSEWERYAKDGDLEGMIRRLLPMPDLQELWARYEREASFKSTVQTLLDEPRVGSAFSAADRPATAKPSPPPARPAAVAEQPKPVVRDPDALEADDQLAVAELSAGPTRRRTGWAMVAAGLLGALGIVGAAMRRRKASALAAPPEPRRVADGGPLRLSERYQILQQLSKTPAEETVEARDPRLDRIVVIRRLSTYDRELRERLQNAAAIVHPALLSVYEVIEEDGRLNIVSERCDGRNLAELLAQRGRLAPDSARRVLEPVCRAIESAHAKGVCHGRLSAAQCLVNDFGVVKLIGLGMSPTFAGEEGRRADVVALAACWRELTGSDEFVLETAGASPKLRTAAELAGKLKDLGSMTRSGVS